MQLATIATRAEGLASRHIDELLSEARRSDWKVLPTFCNLMDRSVDQLKAIAQMEAYGHSVIYSLDLCELLDVSMSIERQALKLSAGKNALRKREVMADIVFSRSVLDSLSLRGFPFTVLPGAAAEITLYLRQEYSRGRAALKREGEGEAVGRDAFALFERLVREEAPRAGTTDRLLRYLNGLLKSPRFVAPDKIPGVLEFTPALFAEIRDAVSLIRRETSPQYNTIFDAVNVASAVSATRGKNAVLHMTRTAALHRFSEVAQVTTEVTFTRTGGEGCYPIIVHPSTVYLMMQLSGSAGTSESAHGNVESFVRFWGDFSSRLREYEVCLRVGKRPTHELASALNRAMQEEHCGGVFRSYLDVFLQNVVFAEQTLAQNTNYMVDSRLQRETLRERVQQASALGRQRRIAELATLLAERLNMPKALSLIPMLPPSLMLRGTLAQELGLYVGERFRHPSGSIMEIVVDRKPVEPDAPLSEAFVFGLQVQREGPALNLFWLTNESIGEFLKDLRFLVGKSEDCWWLAICDGGVVKSGSCSAAAAQHSILVEVGVAKLRVIQIESASFILTYESTMTGRRPLSSIRFQRSSLEDAAQFCQRAGLALPYEVVMDLVEKVVSLPGIREPGK